MHMDIQVVVPEMVMHATCLDLGPNFYVFPSSKSSDKTV